jgi:hypothetical protein
MVSQIYKKNQYKRNGILLYTDIHELKTVYLIKNKNTV